MMISIPSINPVASPTLATIKETANELLDRWQQWSDDTFGGEYRNLVETVIYNILLLIGCTAICMYDDSKRCLGEALGYWLAGAEQQFLAESGLWIQQLAYKLLPVIQACDECWSELARQSVAAQQILAYELNWACSADESLM